MNINIEDYKFHDVIISPYYAPIAFWQYPSLVGFNSHHKGYVEHYKHGKITSLPIHDLKPEATFTETCIYCGWMAYHVFGHFLYESLAAIYFVKQLPPSLPLIFSYSAKKTLETWQKEIFEILGIRNKIILLDKVTNFSNIYLPPPSMALGSYITDSAYEALGVIPDNPQKGKKVYISRRNYKKRTAKNEGRLENILEKRGWEIVYPEKLTIKEQLAKYASAETIFTISGSALHSILFLKNPSQRFIVIPRNHSRSFNIIANKKSDNYYILNCKMKNLNGLTNERAIFALDAKEIEKYLIETDDFKNIDGRDYLSAPPVEANASRFPTSLLNIEIKPELSNSLLYRILKAIRTGEGIQAAKKSLMILIKKGLLQSYMERACGRFVELYMPEISLLLSLKFLALNQASPGGITNELAKILSNHMDFELERCTAYNKTFFGPILSYQCHLSRLGWLQDSFMPGVNGRPNQKYFIEAIRARFADPRLHISYGILTPSNEWLDGRDGTPAGTVGKSQPVVGMRFNLETDANLGLFFRVCLYNKGWSEWKDSSRPFLFGDLVATAIQLKLERRPKGRLIRRLVKSLTAGEN